MAEKCKKCKFYRKGPPPTCHAHPPDTGIMPGALRTNQEQQFEWPPTAEDEWCGEFVEET